MANTMLSPFWRFNWQASEIRRKESKSLAIVLYKCNYDINYSTVHNIQHQRHQQHSKSKDANEQKIKRSIEIQRLDPAIDQIRAGVKLFLLHKQPAALASATPTH